MKLRRDVAPVVPGPPAPGGAVPGPPVPPDGEPPPPGVVPAVYPVPGPPAPEENLAPPPAPGVTPLDESHAAAWSFSGPGGSKSYLFCTAAILAGLAEATTLGWEVATRAELVAVPGGVLTPAVFGTCSNTCPVRPVSPEPGMSLLNEPGLFTHLPFLL